jgi:hypothetical protein
MIVLTEMFTPRAMARRTGRRLLKSVYDVGYAITADNNPCFDWL